MKKQTKPEVKLQLDATGLLPGADPWLTLVEHIGGKCSKEAMAWGYQIRGSK